MGQERVLIVDDDKEIRELVAKYLKKENIKITEADSGEKALWYMENSEFDLVILDIMMGGIDGFEVLKRIRQANESLSVMILSAREEDYDKVLGFGLGADDYVTKPFSPFELTARVKSHLRRNRITKVQSKSEKEMLEIDEFKVDARSYIVHRNGIDIGLSVKEFKLFKFLIENPGQVFTKQQIYQSAWDDGYYDENSLMVYINHLRNKLGEPECIKTVWGIGYKYIGLKERL